MLKWAILYKMGTQAFKNPNIKKGLNKFSEGCFKQKNPLKAGL